MITINELREFMQKQIHNKYAGMTFEEWLANNDGTRGSYAGWVQDADKEVLRGLYEEMDATIKVGLPCTVKFYSDRQPATITDIEYRKNGKIKRVGVRYNEVKPDGTITEEFAKWNPETEYYTLRKCHVWVDEDSPTKDWGTILIIGYRHYYRDESF